MKKLIVVISIITLILGVFFANKIYLSNLGYQKISSEEAKKIIDSHDDYIIIDVRSQSEYDSGHINKAISLPLNQIKNDAKNVLPDKEQLILVYCQSGNRSKKACIELLKLEYSNVKDFGGINSWNYGIIKA